MTIQEKEYRSKSLREKMAECRRIMRMSDDLASKCQKQGIIFADKYPKQYAEYLEANMQFNYAEAEYNSLQNVEIDEEEISNLEE